MLCSFLLALLGVATIVASGIAVLTERPIVRSCSCFRCHVPAYGLSGVMFPGLMVMPNVMAHVSTLACLTLWGSSPDTVVSSSKMGTSSTLPCIKRTFGKKELVAEPPELFQHKCLSHASRAVTHLNRQSLRSSLIKPLNQDQIPQSHTKVSHRRNTIKQETSNYVLNYYIDRSFSSSK
jgi:hypothetical protein